MTFENKNNVIFLHNKRLFKKDLLTGKLNMPYLVEGKHNLHRQSNVKPFQLYTSHKFKYLETKGNIVTTFYLALFNLLLNFLSYYLFQYECMIMIL